MTTKNKKAEDSAGREIVITRVVDAPQELVWEAMTNPLHVVNWWGPRGFTTTIEKMDVRPGGAWEHVMHGPDGTDFPNKSVFTEVVKPERIAFSHGGGRKGGPSVEFEATWTFEALDDGKTKVTIRMVFPTAAARDNVVKEFGAIEGGKQTLERLGEHLQKMSEESEIVITRTLDAPRELVWKAWTESKHLAQWWGPRGFTNPVCEWDARPGNAIHVVMRAPNGADYPMAGKFLEVVAPERLVYTSGALDEKGQLLFEFLHTVTLIEHDGKTKLTIRSRVIKTTAGAARYIGGFEAGMTQSLERLAQCVAKIA